MSVGRREVEKHLKKWQTILRLRDWDIAVKMVGTKWRKSGDVKVDLDNKKVILLINKIQGRAETLKSWRFMNCSISSCTGWIK
jgi:hypothetical protein